ncbi:MAG: hypothetical protein IT459_19210 [Planctomycetes bacterium]|nr:hypothetical protein [Planctomycetota bacterium]
MALIVEDGTGLATAESYVATTAVDTYVAANYETSHAAYTQWTAASTAKKEIALRVATKQYLDVRYRFVGMRANEVQALMWPRSDAYDPDGYEIDSESVPQRVKDALCELALRYVQGDTLAPDISGTAAVEAESVKVGPIEISTDYAGSVSPVKKYTNVDGILSPLLVPGGYVGRS